MVQKITTWKTSDGQVFDNPDEADKHETELQDPKYQTEKQLKTLEDKLIKLEGELLKVSARVEVLESPWGKLNKSPFQNRVFYGTGDTINAALNNLKEVNK